MAGQSQESASGGNKAQQEIIDRFNKIKTFCDSGITICDKAEKLTSDESSKTFEFTELIQEEIEEIRDLLFREE